MNGLKGFLSKTIFNGFFKKASEIVKTKSKHGERLTEWEKLFIWRQLELDKTITCPNCESGKMIEGPQGGMSVNIRCTKCGQGINFLWLPGCKGVDALDWCDNIGIDESWIREKIVKKES